ncbi:hypothetical protein SAMN02745136_00925 [Anaerocolumna jejuensis DSM 15929]|uniref:ATPase AAA-type core domain-containing protein n=1 Tax=Anaerocolumna jejuensis DSM 15929 TaxID=1121322 RepID=A0A1M6MAI4_9FIRM|nr:AAA family ATPase [Anaerocolumna jejuensis]SHJ80508.1 hypothetical protein SAMN02745136_00925 [Anaerocolumna jejuensis DSM 15929]
MFTYLKLKNFKSFKDVEINLQSKKNEPKSLAIIYGANGSGKSTVARAFLTLKRTMETMQVRDMLKSLLDDKYSPPEDMPFKPEIMLNLIKSKLANNTIEKVIDESKMIDSTGPLILEYGFSIKGNTGSYYIEMDNSNIIRERLEYKLSKNRGCYFDIEEDKIEINDKIFESKEFVDEIKKQLQMYWGKHSFLSILLYEMDEKSATYIDSNLSTNLTDVILEFQSISYSVKKAHDDEKISIHIGDDILGNLEGGVIEKSEEAKLNRVEQLINNFFVTLFDDVNKAYYKKNENKGKISYSLYLSKQIEKHKYDIDFRYESSGTQEILDLLPYLMLAVSGKCVVIDEYGNGIHDLLATKLLRAVTKEMRGQLIITTHNTLLMDQADIKPESLYFIMNDKTFSKSVKCVTEIEERLHPNYNYRNRYFNNELYADGLPKFNEEFDFTELAKLYT